ncbi:Spy/CpxP family protein refolding chaperone [Azorhizophilus paspali]|uniref:Spy/CpxP family protein refolding chaperone n=1 Tax=Azorhizophilus paspali TaxID=69963 RepID=A0ABV6SL07_AZOPA
MRKTLSMLLLAAALPAAALAAEPGHPPCAMEPGYHQHKGPEGMQGMMGPAHGLKLTDEQRKAMFEARKEASKENREITQRYLDKLSEADKEAMQKELQASREKADKAFRDQLTPEQQKAFDERKAEQEKRRAEWEEFRKWKAEKEVKPQ